METKDTKPRDYIQYIAGIFDSVGYVRIESSTLFVWITHRSFKVMEILQRFGAYVKEEDGQYRAKWRNKTAYNILKMLRPFLVYRRDMAEVGIEFWEEKIQSPKDDTEIVYETRLKLIRKSDEEGR